MSSNHLLLRGREKDYIKTILKFPNDRVYLLYQESKKRNYNNEINTPIRFGDYALVECWWCDKKQAHYFDDDSGPGPYFECKYCGAFNDSFHLDYRVCGKIYEYSGFMCLNNDYDKTKYTRCKKKYRKYYKELREN